jgi:hypothetical protein
MGSLVARGLARKGLSCPKQQFQSEDEGVAEQESVPMLARCHAGNAQAEPFSEGRY